ncbi:hypothetical protein DFH08DRAFT_1083798 [Mycena albidolilacea]|uniref:Cytochrome c oxidase subunit 1 n=1 Tax=Mycena albidolilacea TaxID=1033008 RepID=A0AAD6ZPX3_9AGAR|nr:hypothetical protein DFH08DRAFT_1083798 [Mycena albidolilacea]
MVTFSVSSLVVLMSLAVPAGSLTNTLILHIPYFHTIPPQSSTWQELATWHFYIPLILLASALGSLVRQGLSRTTVTSPRFCFCFDRVVFRATLVTRRDMTLMRPMPIVSASSCSSSSTPTSMTPTFKVSRRHQCIRRRKTKSPWADLLETLEATQLQALCTRLGPWPLEYRHLHPQLSWALNLAKTPKRVQNSGNLGPQHTLPTNSTVLLFSTRSSTVRLPSWPLGKSSARLRCTARNSCHCGRVGAPWTCAAASAPSTPCTWGSGLSRYHRCCATSGGCAVRMSATSKRWRTRRGRIDAASSAVALPIHVRLGAAFLCQGWEPGAMAETHGA